MCATELCRRSGAPHGQLTAAAMVPAQSSCSRLQGPSGPVDSSRMRAASSIAPAMCNKADRRRLSAAALACVVQANGDTKSQIAVMPDSTPLQPLSLACNMPCKQPELLTKPCHLCCGRLVRRGVSQAWVGARLQGSSARYGFRHTVWRPRTDASVSGFSQRL